MTQIQDSPATHPPIQAQPRRPAARQPAIVLLSLGLVLTLALMAVQHVQYQYRFETLQHQLVATQDSFAGLGEESMQRLQALDERTNDLTRLQGRVLGFAHELERLQQQLQAQRGQLETLGGLQRQQQGQDQQLSGLSGRLDAQAEAIEKGLLVLDTARQALSEQLQDYRQQGEALEQRQQAALDTLQQQQQADRRQLDELAAALAGKNAQDERHQQLQQSVLQLAQQVADDRSRQEELGRELEAFRLQVTRAQDRLQQRLDWLAR